MESSSSPLNFLFQFFFQDLIHSYNSVANIAIIMNDNTVSAVFPFGKKGKSYKIGALIKY